MSGVGLQETMNEDQDARRIIRFKDASEVGHKWIDPNSFDRLTVQMP